MAEYEIPDTLRFSEQDEWARVEGERVVIGVTDYAQQQLGDIVFVELPEVGAELQMGDPFGVIESVKAVSDLFAPVTGTVLEINEALAEQPEAINEDCYGAGFLLTLQPADPQQTEHLLDAAAYRAHIQKRA